MRRDQIQELAAMMYGDFPEWSPLKCQFLAIEVDGWLRRLSLPSQQADASKSVGETDRTSRIG